MNKRKLEAVAVHLRKLLPAWRIEVLGAAEVAKEKLLDPPCALLWAFCGPFHLTLCAEGEGTVGMLSWGLEVDVQWPVDDSMSPKTIAQGVVDGLWALEAG